MSAASILQTVIANRVNDGSAYIDWAPHYAADGCSAPEHGIYFANWNPKKHRDHATGAPEVPSVESRILALIEATGLDAEFEWSDEWSTCGDCGGAFRTSPDSHDWTPSYVYDDGEVTCRDCCTPDYIEARCINNADCADSFDIDWAARGWSRCEPQYESGLHPGQDANPYDIGARIESVGKCDFLFQIDGTGQFDTSFSLWVRPVGFEPDDD